MLPEIITSFEDFQLYTINLEQESLFWIIEYNPTEYTQIEDRYSILRNEILKYPQEFKNRLDIGKYRIWTKTPREIPW